jgi:hypothetical protein
MPRFNYDRLEWAFENFRKLVNINIEEFLNIEKTLRAEIDGRLPSLQSIMELVVILEIKNSQPFWQKTSVFPSAHEQAEIKKEIIELLNKATTLHTLEASIAFIWLAEEQDSIEKQRDYFRSSLKFGIAHGMLNAWKYWGLAMRFSDYPGLKDDACNAFLIAIKEGLSNVHPNKEPASSIWASAKNLIEIKNNESKNVADKSGNIESKEHNINWTRHGRSLNEYIRSQIPGNDWEKFSVLKLQDVLYNNLMNIPPNNGIVFTIGNDAHLIAKVGGEERFSGNFKNCLQNKQFKINISYHEYPTYPLIYIIIQTQPFKDFGIQSIEILADFADVNFQEFAIILNKNKSLFIDIFNDRNKNVSNEKVQVQDEFCDSIVEYIDKCNIYFEKLDSHNRIFSKSSLLFFNDRHPRLPQGAADKPKESNVLKNTSGETTPDEHNKWYKFWKK